MAAGAIFLDWLGRRVQPLTQRLQLLPERDRRALLLLGVFLLLGVLGGALWLAHQQAIKAQREADSQRELLLWMQANAGRIDQRQQTRLPLTELVQQSAAAQGLSVTQNGTAQQVQVAVVHENFAVLSSWLTRLAEGGAEIQQLQVEQQSDGKLQLQATLHQAGG